MRRHLLPLCVFLAVAGAVSAQEKAPTPVVELGLNYSATRWHPAGTPSSTQQGGSATIQYNVNRWLAGVAEIGGGHAPKLGNTTSALVGPRLSLRIRRVTPYVQALAGTTRFSNGFSATNSGAQRSLTTSVGGGVEIAVNDHISLRLAQVDWYNTQFGHRNVRVSAGVVLKVGSK